MIASFPVASVACSHLASKGIGPKRLEDAASYRAYLEAVLDRFREFVPTLPRTLLYTLVFGVTSYTVLSLAVAVSYTHLDVYKRQESINSDYSSR